jgi:hypothetical protein
MNTLIYLLNWWFLYFFNYLWVLFHDCIYCYKEQICDFFKYWIFYLFYFFANPFYSHIYFYKKNIIFIYCPQPLFLFDHFCYIYSINSHIFFIIKSINALFITLLHFIIIDESDLTDRLCLFYTLIHQISFSFF